MIYFFAEKKEYQTCREPSRIRMKKQNLVGPVALVERKTRVTRQRSQTKMKSKKRLMKKVRIDKMLSPVVEGVRLEDVATAIHSIESRLEKLASKGYIDNSLKKLV